MVDIPAEIVVATSSTVYADAVIRVLADHPKVHLLGIICSTRFFGSQASPIRSRWSVMRRSGLAYVQYLTRISDPRLARFGLPAWQTPKQWAAALDIAYLETSDINRPTSIEFLQQLSPEFLLTAHFDQQLSAQLLAVKDWIPVNYHPSILPDYKGADPVFAAMLQGQNRLGVSLHRVTATPYGGPLFGQRAFSSSENDSLAENTLKLANQGARLFCAIAATAQPFRNARPQAGEGFEIDWPNASQVRQFLTNDCLLI